MGKEPVASSAERPVLVQRYKEVTVTMGPTLKIGDVFVRASVSITAVGEDLSVPLMMADLERLYAHALLRELQLSSVLEGVGHETALKIAKGMAAGGRR